MGDLVLFDTREAAAAWGVSQRTVERWVHRGHAKPVKQAAGWIFTGDEIRRVAQVGKPRRGRPRRSPQRDTLPGTS